MTEYHLIEMAYALVAVVLFIGTLVEGYFARGRWDARRVLGLGACLVWPLLLVIFAIVAGRQKRRRGLKPATL